MALQAQSRQPPLIWPSPRPRTRSTITLLRSEPRKHADTTAHFVDKPHFAPQNKYCLVFFTCAQVAELADALASGASGLTVVEVRVLSWAPNMRGMYATARNSPTATKVCFPAEVFRQD